MQSPDSTASQARNHQPLSGIGGGSGRKAAQQYLDTPRKSGTPRSIRDLTLHRSEILIQMKNEMVHCREWGETGFDHYLPANLSTADIDAAVAALKKAHLVEEFPTSDGSRIRFKDYPVSPSNIETVNEKTRYKPLLDIGKVLQRIVLTDGRKASCEFLQKPDNFNEAETPGANFKIDAVLKLRHSTMPASVAQTSTIPVADLAVPSEYKTYRRDFRENRKQLLGTTTFCMNDDPRRKYIYGITIEDDTMAVWYFSRSHSAKSPDFRFTEDCRTYIRVMLSLMFATEEELGYDQTVQRRLDPQANKLCFVYRVGSSYYKTQHAIFDHRSLCTTGRATRVWAVIEVASFDDLRPLQKSSTMVLKDVWLDADSMTEGRILREIFDDLEKIAASLAEGTEPEAFKGMDGNSKKMLRKCLLARTWKRYFLTIDRDWEGAISKDVAPTASPDSTLFGAPPATVKLSSFPQSDLSRTSVSHPTDLVPPAEPQPDRRYCPKRQHRVVFKEVCVALHDVSTLHDVLTALLSCVFALQLMFVAGWVHRDLSSGNLYWLMDGDGEGRGILADLEYAKRFRPNSGNSSSDPKTGTAFFMAVEIQKQVPMYIPPTQTRLSHISGEDTEGGDEDEDDDDDDDTDGDEDEYEDKDADKDPGEDEDDVGGSSIVHNFEHDLESIFWLLLWTVLARFPCERSPADTRVFAGFLSEVFQDTSVCTTKRERVFRMEGPLRKILARFLAPQLFPFKRYLETLRGYLMAGYIKREYNHNDLSSYSYLYKHVRKALKGGQRLTRHKSLPELLPCRSHRPTAGPAEVNRPLQVKRDRSRSNAGGDDDEFSPRSKAARMQENTDASTSRTLREKNLGLSYIEGDSDQSMLSNPSGSDA